MTKMNRVITIFLITAVLVFASSIDQPVQPSVGFLNQVWNKVGKYYRYARRKFSCFMWGTDCYRPQQPQSPPTSPITSAADSDWNETIIENANWFEKRINWIEKDQPSTQEVINAPTNNNNGISPALNAVQQISLPTNQQNTVPFILPKKNNR